MEKDPVVDAFELKVAHLLCDLRLLDAVDEALKHGAGERDPAGEGVKKGSTQKAGRKSKRIGSEPPRGLVQGGPAREVWYDSTSGRIRWTRDSPPPEGVNLQTTYEQYLGLRGRIGRALEEAEELGKGVEGYQTGTPQALQLKLRSLKRLDMLAELLARCKGGYPEDLLQNLDASLLEIVAKELGLLEALLKQGQTSNLDSSGMSPELKEAYHLKSLKNIGKTHEEACMAVFGRFDESIRRKGHRRLELLKNRE